MRLTQDSQDLSQEDWGKTRKICKTGEKIYWSNFGLRLDVTVTLFPEEVILYKISSVEMSGCFILWLITGGELDWPIINLLTSIG